MGPLGALGDGNWHIMNLKCLLYLAVPPSSPAFISDIAISPRPRFLHSDHGGLTRGLWGTLPDVGVPSQRKAIFMVPGLVRLEIRLLNTFSSVDFAIRLPMWGSAQSGSAPFSAGPSGLMSVPVAQIYQAPAPVPRGIKYHLPQPSHGDLLRAGLGDPVFIVLQASTGDMSFISFHFWRVSGLFLVCSGVTISHFLMGSSRVAFSPYLWNGKNKSRYPRYLYIKLVESKTYQP